MNFHTFTRHLKPLIYVNYNLKKLKKDNLKDLKYKFLFYENDFCRFIMKKIKFKFTPASQNYY